ncbi:MAG: class I SAM-dependent methyltransferase [Balneolaceae bacterium]
MNELDPSELSSQLRKPTGETGLGVAAMLNKSNRGLYDLAWSVLKREPSQRLLEIGFGNGNHFSRYFESESARHVTGLDFSPTMCEEAQLNHSGWIENGKLEIVCADSKEMPFEAEEFDWVIALNVIYFWEPPEPHLDQLMRVLKPGGHLLFGFRPRSNVEHLEFTKQNFILYEPEELKALIEQAGFQVVQELSRQFEMEPDNGEPISVTDICMVAKKE